MLMLLAKAKRDTKVKKVKRAKDTRASRAKRGKRGTRWLRFYRVAKVLPKGTRSSLLLPALPLPSFFFPVPHLLSSLNPVGHSGPLGLWLPPFSLLFITTSAFVPQLPRPVDHSGPLGLWPSPFFFLSPSPSVLPLHSPRPSRSFRPTWPLPLLSSPPSKWHIYGILSVTSAHSMPTLLCQNFAPSSPSLCTLVSRQSFRLT